MLRDIEFVKSGGVKSVLLNYGQTQVPFFVRQSRFKRYLGACPAILVRQRRKWLAPWCASAGHGIGLYVGIDT